MRQDTSQEWKIREKRIQYFNLNTITEKRRDPLGDLKEDGSKILKTILLKK
jgi:hypothetical protein